MSEQSNINRVLASQFLEISGIMKFLKVKPEQADAFSKAADVIASVHDDITVYVITGQIKELPGMNRSIINLIKEYITTGKIKKLDQLRRKFPEEYTDLLFVPGIGPSLLRSIYDELKISTLRDLEKALENGSVAAIKGIGQKTVELIQFTLEKKKPALERILLWKALKAGGKILDWMNYSEEVGKIKIVGSLRRRKETVSNIDVIVSCEPGNESKVIDRFIDPSFAAKSVVKEKNIISIVLKDSGKHVKLRLVDENEWGAALVYYTGSWKHIGHLKTIAKSKGLTFDQHGIYKGRSKRKIAGRTEDGIYKALGLQMMPPEMREDHGEIELAQKNQVPELITLTDIKGDMQVHTNWSDGRLSIEQIVRYVRRNFNYEYIVVTDHSKSLNGLDEREVMKQIKRIRDINKKLGIDFVKCGIEVEILEDGRPDLSPDILRKLDWVTAAVHTRLDQDVTERLIRAAENPLIHCITHPSGRMIGVRNSYQVNIDEVIDAAKATGTVLEINAQPLRMDLNEELACRAREKGAMLYISTDAHDGVDLHYMKLGVAIARRAWCSKEHVLNTRSWKELGDLVYRKKSKASVKIAVR